MTYITQLIVSSIFEFVTTFEKHLYELFAMGVFFSMMTYTNITCAKVKKMRDSLQHEISVLKALYCVKEIRESRLDKLMGNEKEEREYIVTLLPTEEFRKRTTAGVKSKENTISILKGMTIIEKNVRSQTPTLV